MRVAKVNFNDCIGNDFWFGGISEQFVRYCVEGPNCYDPALSPAYPEAVELHFFNCPGGEVYEGYAIYSYLRGLVNAGVKVSAYVHGLCASIASLVVLAADERYVGPLGSTMIHKPLVDAGPWANADDHRAAATQLDQIEAQITGIYASRTGIAAALLPDLMRAETTFTAAEAIANGFATALLEDTPAPVAEKAKKVLNYATPKPPAAMAILNDTEKKGFIAELKAMFGLKETAPKATATAAPPTPPAAEATPPPAAEMSGTEVALSDGTSIFVDTSDDGIADIDEGDAVFTDEALTIPVADGDYTLEDSRDFTVAGGVVTVIAADPAAAETAAPAAPPTPPAAEAPRQMSAQAKLKVAEAKLKIAQDKLAAHVPGAGNPNKPGAQAFAGTDNAAAHPLDGAAKKVNDKLQRGQ